MFCPLSVDWGNAADWAAAIGSLCAVFAALYIAGSERRHVENRRRIEENQEYERHAHVKAEAIRLLAEGQALATNLVQLVNFGGASVSSIQETVDGIQGLRIQLQALQRFPISDPRLFAEIGRAALEHIMDVDLPTKSTSYVGIMMDRVREKLEARQQAIAAL